jgi:hypothetical protein
MLANPPFGVEWKKVEKDSSSTSTRREQGFAGRFGAGLPRINDGSLLFLQHMISKMKRPRRAAPAWRSSSTARRCSPARRLGRERDPPLDHRERLARGHRRPARPALLQHRHLHLLLDRHQPQEPRAARARSSSSTPAELLHQDAQEPRQQAQRDQRRPDRRDHVRLYGTPGWTRSKTKVGYEINFNRYFYKYTPPRPLDEIEADLKRIEEEIADMLAEVTE